MTTETLFESIQHKLGMKWSTPEENRLDGILHPTQLLDAVDVLHTVEGLYLIAITGIDDGAESNSLHVLYHFASGASVITLRVNLDRTAPLIDSICSILPYASPYERETGEMFGITFMDTPDTSRLFLPDDWTDGVYPLRKDTVLEGGNHDDDH